MRHSLPRLAGAAAVVALTVAMTGSVKAEPAADALAKLNELSKQALETRQSVTQAQRDADAGLAAQKEAEDRYAADRSALDAATAELDSFQAAIDRAAAMAYVNGGSSQWEAALIANSPQDLLDSLSLQRTVAGVTAEQLAMFREGRQRAATAATASEKSAADARAAAEKSAALRAELQAKFGDLQRQVLAAEAQYAALTPSQQAVVDAAAAVPPPAPDAPPPDAQVPPPANLAAAVIPDAALPVGVANESGLQPNTILAARAVSAQFPQINDIGGYRPDSKPWHPSGLALDIMVPNPRSPEGLALGDAIVAYVLSNSARFGLQDAIWNDDYYTPSGPSASGYGHLDHVHVTTTPR